MLLIKVFHTYVSQTEMPVSQNDAVSHVVLRDAATAGIISGSLSVKFISFLVGFFFLNLRKYLVSLVWRVNAPAVPAMMITILGNQKSDGDIPAASSTNDTHG